MENVVRKLFMENSFHGDAHVCRASVTKYDIHVTVFCCNNCRKT